MNPRQWSLVKQSSLKVENIGPKVPKQAKAEWDGVINPPNYNFNKFNTENFDTLKTLRINRSRP